jgi:hypothetical protein
MTDKNFLGMFAMFVLAVAFVVIIGYLSFSPIINLVKSI